MAGAIFALDLASRTGFAVGRPGAYPRSGTVVLKKKGEHRRIALGNMVAWLNEEWTRERPALVVKEAAFSLQAFRDHANAESTVLMTYGLHGIVEAMAVRFGIRIEEGHPATIRKHFLGKARCGTRAQTKAAVIQRCHVLALMPKISHDADRADALATWDWAAATFGRARAAELHLFDEAVA